MSAGPVLFANLAGNLKRFRPGQQESRASDLPLCSGFQTERRKRNGEAAVSYAFQTVAYRR
jgi:hypothetical protein